MLFGDGFWPPDVVLGLYTFLSFLIPVNFISTGVMILFKNTLIFLLFLLAHAALFVITFSAHWLLCSLFLQCALPLN
ncbi:MAG: hypothetical protein JJ900_18150 [Rhodospirillales bacterium]|nr:hypothetical protein [Rhodospirillales bacterium]MBO6788775.1 hypothetical protein [Rhodospirillales bacterium]